MGMGRCILHVGMHKTGSTSIQWSLNGFADERFLYARLGWNPNHSAAIYSLFAPNARERRHARKVLERKGGDYMSASRKALDQTQSEAGQRTLIISAEGIGTIPAPGLAALRSYLRARFEDILVVGYVRPPGSALSSRYLHRTKNTHIPLAEVERVYPHYRAFFAKLDDVFGADRVHLWKFDPGAFPEGCVVRDFCARLGIDLPADRIVRRNEGLSRQVVSLLYTYRTFAGRLGWPPVDSVTRKALRRLGGDRFRLSPDLIRPVLARHRLDIEWMEARCGQSLHEDLGEYRPGDVCEEADLLRVDPGITGKVLELLGDSAPQGVRGDTVEEVARLVDALRRKLNPAEE